MSFKWGILGPGRIAAKFADAVAAIDGTSIHAVASRSPERASDFGDRFNIPVRLDSYRTLAQHPELDAIYVATPHRFHFEQASICLNAGKHVLCEKSITVNAQECEQLIQLSKDNNVFLMEALWTRFLPIYGQVRAVIDSGRIGEPIVVDSTFCFPITGDRPDRLWRHDLAGGALLDIGVYNIAISQWVMRDNPSDFQVTAHLSDTRVDERISAILSYSPSDQGRIPRVSQFTCGFHSEGENDFRISGTSGTVRIHRRFWGADTATIRTADGFEETVNAPHRINGFEYQIEEMMRCIAQGELESEIMSHADSLANMKLMDAIRSEIGLRYDFE